MSDKDNRVIKLGDRELNIVKNGLSKNQVKAYIDELVSEHNRPVQPQEHLSSLAKLGEKIVIEAEKLATDIKMEAAKLEICSELIILLIKHRLLQVAIWLKASYLRLQITMV